MSAEILPACDFCGRELTMESEIGPRELDRKCAQCSDIRADAHDEYQAQKHAEAMARWEQV